MSLTLRTLLAMSNFPSLYMSLPYVEATLSLKMELVKSTTPFEHI